MHYIISSIFLLLISSCNNINCSSLENARNAHKELPLTDNQVVTLASLTDRNNLEYIINNIAIERIVGTEGHTKVKKFIINYLKGLDWHVQRHGFQDETPNFGKLKFENIIGTLNPEADRFLVLACHYDSKYMKSQKFIGAIDSAVPCAMILNLLYVMKPLLDQIKDRTDVSIKVVFFDGEEAFYEWGPKDSIYGARRLAAKLSNDVHRIKSNEVVTELSRWDLLVLLDLLGTPDPTFYNYIHSGSKWYSKLISSENELSKLHLLENYSNGKPQQRYFRPVSMASYIEDDHIPFLKRGVPIVHVIPSPFPEVWHTVYDNLNAIDYSTVENLNKIFRIFVAKYLHLPV